MKKLITTIVLLLGLQSTFFAQLKHEPGQVIIQLTALADLDKVIQDYSSEGLEVNRLLSRHMRTYLLYFDANKDEEALLRKLKSDGRISIAQFNHPVEPRETIPNDPNFSSQWHHVNNGSGSATEDADIDSDLAWDITTGGLTADGDTIVACIIEGGNLEHPDLEANAWINHHEIPDNGIDDDENGFVDDYYGWNVSNESDEGLFSSGHGTSVMGMIGARGDNEVGVVGANWNVKMMAVTGQNIGNEASVIEAYNYPLEMRKLYDQSEGEQGAFVVVTNASWGIDFGDPEDVPIWAAFYDTLGLYGILNCGATSNLNINIDETGDIPTAVDSDYMIAVTATNNQDNRTFSGYGLSTIDLGAPGENVYTTSLNSYTSTSGTSFASPLTAGVVALLYSVPCDNFINLVKSDPQAGANLVKAALLAGVDLTGNLFSETRTGGRLNAYNSLLQLLDNCDQLNCVNPHGLNYALLEGTDYFINWYEPNDSSSYTLRYRVVGTEDWNYLSDLTGSSILLENLEFCSEYELQITTQCGEPEEYFYSQSVLFNTEGCCEPTTGNLIFDIDTTSADISWDEIISAEGYEVYLAAEGSEEFTLYGSFTEPYAELNNLEVCTSYSVVILPLCGVEFQLEELPELTFTTDGCCEPTINNGITNISATGATVFWETITATNLYEIFIQPEGLGEYVSVDTVTGSEAILTGLDSCTVYQVKIKPICNQDLDLTDLETVIFNTSGCGNCVDLDYCESAGESTSDEFIASVTIADVEMESGNNGGYELFEATNLILSIDSTYGISLSPGFSGTSYQEYFRIWIDYNQDGTFSSNELAFDADVSTTTEITGEISIPSTALEGGTRMRTSMKYVGFSGTPPQACEQFSYGEVEDYCITLEVAEVTPGIQETSAFGSLQVFPNPAASQVHIDIRDILVQGIVYWEVIDASGRTVLKKQVVEGQNIISLDLGSGMYIYHFKSDDQYLSTGKLVIE